MSGVDVWHRTTKKLIEEDDVGGQQRHCSFMADSA